MATPEPEPAFAIDATVAPRLATAAPFFFEPFFGALSFAAGGGMSESAAAIAAGLPGSGGAEGGGPFGPMPSLEAGFVDVVEGALGATPGGVLGGIGAEGGVFVVTNVALALLLGDALGMLGGIGAEGGADADAVAVVALGAVAEVGDALGGMLGRLGALGAAAVASLAVFRPSFVGALSLKASLSPLLEDLLPPPPRAASSMPAPAEPLLPFAGAVRLAMRVSVGSSVRPGFERTTS